MSIRRALTAQCIVFAVGIVTACSTPSQGFTAPPTATTPPGDASTDAADSAAAHQPSDCPVQALSYTSLAGSELQAGGGPTLDAPLRADRMRIKPIDTLRGEFVRVFGAVPPLLQSADSLLGVPQARWSREPILSSFALHTIMRAGYASCGPYVSQHPAWLSSVDTTELRVSCTEMLQTVWLRAPNDKQLNACVAIATGDALPEGARGKSSPPLERWQYACVYAVTSPEFLSYGASR